MPGDFDGDGDYGEPTSERIQTPPGEVNSQTMIYMGGTIFLSLMFCCCYVEGKRRIKNGKKKSNIKDVLKKSIFNNQRISTQSSKKKVHLEDMSLFKGT